MQSLFSAEVDSIIKKNSLQVRGYLDEGFENALIVWNDFQNLTVTSWNRGQTMAREWTRAVIIGNMTLEEIIFSEEIKQL